MLVRLHEARADGEPGFTLVELLVALTVFGILAGLGGTGFSAVQKSLEARGAHREIVSILRTVQARSVAENVAYCVAFSAGATPNSWTVYRVPGADQGSLPGSFSCTSGTSVDAYQTPGATSFSSIAFAQRNGTSTNYVLFFARGAASGGGFMVGGGAPAYTITVDAVTGRVTSSGA